jgi:hypothetical protein
LSSSKPSSLSHDALCRRAARWLRAHGYPTVLVEARAQNTYEIPDVIGWGTDGLSYLLEVKTSRADFRQDRHKLARGPLPGMGYRRSFFAPVGVIPVLDVPEGWGLLELAGRSVQLTKKPADPMAGDPFSMRQEMVLLTALLRRQVPSHMDLEQLRKYTWKPHEGPACGW